MASKKTLTITILLDSVGDWTVAHPEDESVLERFQHTNDGESPDAVYAVYELDLALPLPQATKLVAEVTEEQTEAIRMAVEVDRVDPKPLRVS